MHKSEGSWTIFSHELHFDEIYNKEIWSKDGPPTFDVLYITRTYIQCLFGKSWFAFETHRGFSISGCYFDCRNADWRKSGQRYVPYAPNQFEFYPWGKMKFIIINNVVYGYWVADLIKFYWYICLKVKSCYYIQRHIG